jgi:hypothetical protein
VEMLIGPDGLLGINVYPYESFHLLPSEALEREMAKWRLLELDLPVIVPTPSLQFVTSHNYGQPVLGHSHGVGPHWEGQVAS